MEKLNQWHSPVAHVSADATLRQAAGLMRAKGVETLIVVDDGGRQTSFVTIRDLVFKVMAEGGDPEARRVRSVMETNVHTIAEDSSPWMTLAEMRKTGATQLMVVRGDGKIVVATVSIEDVMFALGSSFVLAAELARPGRRDFEHDFTKMA